MKMCSVCLAEKPAAEFQIRRMSPDGRTAACRECLRKRDAARYGGEREKRNAWRRRYSKTVKGKQVVDRADKKWQERNLLKRAAHLIVGNAIRNKKLVKQRCERCFSTHVHAHHDDYSRPLDVRWLCPFHHKEMHRV